MGIELKACAWRLGAPEFRARFAEGQLQSIVRVEDKQEDDRV
jgi:hypothetical protein